MENKYAIKKCKKLEENNKTKITRKKPTLPVDWTAENKAHTCPRFQCFPLIWKKE